MVSFWPWKADNTSPASFEKTLSALSAKISKTGGRLDGLRQRSRRYSVFWTLYAGFAYLLCAIILVLVVGWRNWGIAHAGGIVGGPAVIYTVRLGLTKYYDYRISAVQSQLEELQKQRESTIEKLKVATKYNSTQELLKKYSGTPTPKAQPGGKSDRKDNSKQNRSGGDRIMLTPPATANIPGRNQQPSAQGAPPRTGVQQSSSPAVSSPLQRPVLPRDPSADFAPNAFPAAPQYAPKNEGSSWYDRLLDVLLGEDETLPGKRLALICAECRLVNGQAPPGVTRLEDVGKWRCGGCGAMNGEENDMRKIVEDIKQRTSESSNALQADASGTEMADETRSPDAVRTGQESDITQYSSSDSDEDEKVEILKEGKQKPTAEPEIEPPRRRSTRPKAERKRKG